MAAQAQAIEEVDLIVIGAGQGGIPLAVDHAAAKSERVVLFERERLGGSCVNFGCTPSKAFLAAAHSAARAREAKELGIHAEVRVDFAQVMKRVREIRDAWQQGSEKRVKSSSVRLVRAEGTFVGERTVGGGGVTVRAPRVVINTGTHAAVPDIPGLRGTPYLADYNVFELDALPPRTVVIGGGYVGLELGQGLQRLGSQVTLIERGERLFGREEPDVSETLREALLADGVEIRLKAAVERVEHRHGLFRLELKGGGRLEAEALLVALGRTPNTERLNLEATGATRDDRGYVRVNGQLETACPGVYAIGDVAGQPAFTHVSWEDSRRLESTFAGKPRMRDDRVLGYASFTEPQVGRAGLTEEEGRARGLSVRSVTMPIKSTARGREMAQVRGFYRMVVDTSDDRILGATLVAPEAAELAHVFLGLIECGAKWQTLEALLGIHPAWGEGLPSLARLLKS